MAEFPRRNWSLAAVKRLLQKIDATGSADLWVMLFKNSYFSKLWHRLPYGPRNGSFIAAVPLSERTRKAGTWTVYKGGQCAKWCRMQQLGPGRLHRSSVSSWTHSQWTLWGLWLGHRWCGHSVSQTDWHWEGTSMAGEILCKTVHSSSL